MFILSSLSNTAMESVFAQAASPRWFQLYVYKDREITLALVQRAEAAGAEAIVLTVDAPGLGTRERDARNSFRLPDGLAVENLAPLGKGDFPEVQGSGLAAYVQANFKEDLGFDDLDWLCGVDALAGGGERRVPRRRRAPGGRAWREGGGGFQSRRPPARHRARHLRSAASRGRGGRAIDARSTSTAGFDAAAMCSRRLHSGRAPCWWAGPVLWGLCVGGEEGALHVLEILRRELDEAMLLCGCTKLGEIDGALLKA